MPKPRQHVTVAGRIVYDRPLHKFTEKDAFRIVRSLLDDNISNPFQWFSMFLIGVWRVVLTGLRRTQFLRQFIIDFAAKGLPKIIGEVLTDLNEEADDAVVFVLNYLLSWLSGLKPSKTLNREEEEARDGSG